MGMCLEGRLTRSARTLSYYTRSKFKRHTNEPLFDREYLLGLAIQDFSTARQHLLLVSEVILEEGMSVQVGYLCQSPYSMAYSMEFRSTNTLATGSISDLRWHCATTDISFGAPLQDEVGGLQ